MLIPFTDVLKHCHNITGIIHVGAHTAEESKDYGAIPTIWIEADKTLFDALKVPQKYHFAATNYVGTAKLNIMPFRAANSLLEPHLNKEHRKDIYVTHQEEVPANKISNIQPRNYNFINLDIQGAELNALKGTDLSKIDYIYTEFNEVETYKNCTQLHELNSYLLPLGFKEVAKETTKYGWGDILYVRK